MKKNHQKHAGITLIELSIVLVVMGFLAASIIIGKDLILSAQIRGQISQFHEMDAAVLAFRDKYNCLPGDCSNTVARGIAPRTGSQWDGNDNGQIEKEYFAMTDLTPGFRETDNFWTHLLHAGFVTGFQQRESGDRDFVIGEQSPKAVMPALRTLPFNPVNEDTGMITGTPGLNLNFFDFKLNGFDPSVVYTSLPANSFTIGIEDDGFNLGIVRPDIAYMLDEKMDDGLPSSGKLRGKFYHIYTIPQDNVEMRVRSVAARVGHTEDPNNPPIFCVDTTVTPNQYRIGLTESYSHCAIIYQGSWD